MNISHVSTADLPSNTVTPQGIILVAQWVFLLFVCYKVIAIAFQLVTFLLRWLWRLLTVGVALACFTLILNADSVGTETKAIRLLGLSCVWILFSIQPRRDQTMDATSFHLKELIKILQDQVSEMERWRRRSAILSCCLVMMFFAFWL